MGTNKPPNKDILYDPIQTKEEPLQEERKKYPRAVFIIVLNEFCERFSYSGMRAFLALYLKQKLLYSDDEATEIYHVFTTAAYFCAIFGAILADSYIGKFRTILYLMVIYAIGNVLISVTAIPPLGIPGREFTLIGLLMIALGTGGIKPCVSSFGGDQFILPQQEKQLTTFFSILYFILCLASLVAKSVSPLLRSKIQCFGDKDCFSIAFGAPGILIIISIVFFACAKKMYIIKKPSGNILSEVAKCICISIKKRKSTPQGERKISHWLDYAQESFDQTFIDNVKKTLRIFVLFTPLLVFWALLDQLGSRWTLQASRMNGDFGNFNLKPDQVQVLCPIFILILIPIFKYAVYPVLTRHNILTNLLHRLIAGCILAACSFIFAGVLEMHLEKTYPILPTEGNGQLRIFNAHRDCVLHFSNSEMLQNFTVNPMAMHVEYIPDVNERLSIAYNKTLQCNNYTVEGEQMLGTEEGRAISFVFQKLDSSNVVRYEDQVSKARSGLPYVRIITNFQSEHPPHIVTLQDDKGNTELRTNSSLSGLIEVFAGAYTLHVNGTRVELDINVRIGGVYTILIHGNKHMGYNASIITITEPNSISMAWVLPQMLTISVGEVLFAITGLEFAFKEAPESMKAVLQAYWLLIEAFGNILIIAVTRFGAGFRQVYHFFFFAILLFLATIVFYFLMRRYERQSIRHTQAQYNEPFDVELDQNNATVTSQHKYLELLKIDDTLDH